jgi:phosphohistidine phosphatase SixA
MIVFALRHADRVSNGDALTPDGIIRAELLARLLGESGVTVAIRSNAERAKQTLQPLANRLGGSLDIKEIPIADAKDAENHANKVIDLLKQLPAQTTVVYVGHDATVEKLVKKLTGMTVVVNPDEFDKLFVISLHGGAGSAALMRYGKPTPP